MKTGINYKRLILAAIFFTACGQSVYGWEEPTLITNKTAIANGKTVFEAILSADSQSKTNIQALIGSQVEFFAHGGPHGTNFVLTLQSNVVLTVEFNPPYQWRSNIIGRPPVKHEFPLYYYYSSEVLGTLKSVDLEKRVINVVAKQEDWKFQAGF